MSDDGAPVILLDGITVRREGATLLRDVTWELRRGTHWALLGANGSGKTSLLKVLTGYEWPSEGRVTVFGSAYGACDIRMLRRAMGWVSGALVTRIPREDLALDVVLSGIDATFGVYRTFSELELQAARGALERMGVAELETRMFGVLSQGESQRVLIARALVSEPPLMVLDEPCAGLDPAARFEFLEDLAALAAMAASPTLIFVTHHVEEIGPWIDSVHVLKAGRTLAQGPPDIVVTSAVMSAAFGRPCHVTRKGAGFALRLV